LGKRGADSDQRIIEIGDRSKIREIGLSQKGGEEAWREKVLEAERGSEENSGKEKGVGSAGPGQLQ